MRRPIWRNPVFWIGVALAGGAIAYAWIGDPAVARPLGLLDASLGADGRCTGFPNGLGRWNWSHCCVEHDAGGSDGGLLDCLLGAVPGWAWPLCGLGVTLMIACRPIYNVLQRWGWVK